MRRSVPEIHHTYDLSPAELTKLYARAAECLSDGGVALLPTDTVYGLAMRIDSKGPAALIEEITRLHPDPAVPLSWHTYPGDPLLAPVLARAETRVADRLLSRWSNKGVGFIYRLPDVLRAPFANSDWVVPATAYQDGWLAFRCPAHQGLRDILRRVNAPISMINPRHLTGYGTDASSQTTEALAPDAPVDLVIDSGPTPADTVSTVIRICFDSVFSIARTGHVTEAQVMKSLESEIIFVCTGNTCRSPLAEVIARKVMQSLEFKGITFAASSAGVTASNGDRATPPAINAARALGLDLAPHRSRRLTPAMIKDASFVFCMTEAHVEAARALASHPEDASKIERLDPGGDIHDPYGGPQSLYDEVADHLSRVIAQRISAYDFDIAPSTTAPSTGSQA